MTDNNDEHATLDYYHRFRVKPGSHPKLADIEPGFCDRPMDKASAEPLLERNRARLGELQMGLYAEKRHSVLICLQGLDTAGKDGIVTHLLGCMNPLSCTVTGFKVPSAEEAAHDFLWRYHRAAPALGWVGIFNRTQYESVLVERVHKLVPKSTWSQRYQQIADFERMLSENGTTVIKIYLHISKKEQLRRFRDRLDDRAKQWKISEADYAERKYWDDYVEAYEEAFARCSTHEAPWFIVPSNHKWFRSLAVSQILVQAIEKLQIAAPVPSVDIAEIRRKYHDAEKE
jgi:PPK2 family polyphosphate:nucleotide phosphotransferase